MGGRAGVGIGAREGRVGVSGSAWDGGTAARAGEFSAGRGREAEKGGERLVY